MKINLLGILSFLFKGKRKEVVNVVADVIKKDDPLVEGLVDIAEQAIEKEIVKRISK